MTRLVSEGDSVHLDRSAALFVDDSITLNDTWAEMEKVLVSGKARAIGVSNFSIKTYVLKGVTGKWWLISDL